MSKLYSVLRLKCPRCRKGNLFSKPNPYSFKDSLDMPDNCPVCGQDFKIEPGFYIGALWTSFPIVIFIMTLLSVLLLVYFKMELNLFFVALTLILFLLQPIIIRYGRAIWIHVFVDYDSDAEIK
ncbi:DUF983 domain-containing protein [Dyadobacter pollutisoli]|uniref:DUF983 domain-containing protein n=1 Tax=Dyadobacter pollutisoli TaxID=2910158 RepID=A0A9E8N5L6_9BACT|nr:DUF983 domain-containing protein [Dyadobacter pollutisoli]WAC10255.1 DUF983 domain-containing protein [Dyadobacter pollutisoli]